MKNLRAVLSSVLGIFFAISLVTACSDAMLTEVKPLARKNISISAEGSSFDNIELPEEGTKKVYILVTSENGEDIANDTEITVISSDEESVTASAGAPEEMPEAPAAKRNAVFYNWFKDNDLDAHDGGGSSTPAPKKYKVPLELTCLKKADEDVIVTVLANCPDHFSKKIDITVTTTDGIVSPSPFLALELTSGTGVNISGGKPGGGKYNTTVETTIPYKLSDEYKTYQIPVTLNSVDKSAGSPQLKVPIKWKSEGTGASFSRTFTLDGEEYTFDLVKSVHFTKTDTNGYLTDNVTITANGANLNMDRNTSSSWNAGFGNWAASDTQEAKGGAHVLGIKDAKGDNVTISIPENEIGEYDYVEFSLNFWDAKAPTISFTGANGGKMVCKPYSGNDIGIGIGDWKTDNNVSESKDLPQFLPLLGNGTIDSFRTKNENYVVGGAYIPSTSEDKKCVLFMQNGQKQDGADNPKATLENQAAALVQYYGSDELKSFYNSNNGNFTMKLEDVDDKIYVFDYIAFYKKQ